jgi:short-subunit dehydrogenase
MDNNNSILITGTSSGIGKSCALYLDQLGFTVFAGVRKEADGEELKKAASDKLTPIVLDVTDQDSIDKAFSLIKDRTQGELYGLINNAGIGCSGALEATSLKKIRDVMEVNVIGLMAVTKAFLPILRNSKGRVINIGSTSGFIAIPGGGVYAASKFAVRAITDSLRLELKHFGMKVILVAPGAIESKIWDKSAAYKMEMRKNIPSEIADQYTTLRRFGDKILETIKKIPAIQVAKAVAHGLTAKNPKRYFVVGDDAKGAARAARLPKAILDWAILKRIERMVK